MKKPNLRKKVHSCSVRVMRSYDYSHFEVSLGINSDSGITLQRVNQLRKEAQLLVDEAVRQYKKAKTRDSLSPSENQVERIKTEYSEALEVPESERTPQHKAAIKDYRDYLYWLAYEYEGDWGLE